MDGFFAKLLSLIRLGDKDELIRFWDQKVEATLSRAAEASSIDAAVKFRFLVCFIIIAMFYYMLYYMFIICH